MMMLLMMGDHFVTVECTKKILKGLLKAHDENEYTKQTSAARQTERQHSYLFFLLQERESYYDTNKHQHSAFASGVVAVGKRIAANSVALFI